MDCGQQGIIHYLDDFLIIGSPGSDKCEVAVERVLHLFDELGFLVAQDKLEGPETRLTFLGFELEMTTMEICLSHQKLRELRHLSYLWRSQKACSRRDLKSLVGKLAHATQMVQSGKTFLRRMLRAAGCEG